MMTDESLLEWASGWIRDNSTEDPTFRERFLEGLASELKARRAVIITCFECEPSRTSTNLYTSPASVPVCSKCGKPCAGGHWSDPLSPGRDDATTQAGISSIKQRGQ